MSFIVIFSASAVAVAALVGLSAWARIARPCPPLERRSVLSLFADEFPYRRLEGLWIAEDGAGALAKSGADALIAFRLGDAYVARAVPWTAVESARRRKATVRLSLRDAAAPTAVFRFSESAAWPPRLEALA